MSLLLIRHGATEWSEDGRHTSTTDLPLTAAGAADAEALRPVLASRSFTVVASSPRARALDTCRRSGIVPTGGGAVEVWDDLVEWDYGGYEGVTTPDIQAGRPGWELFRDGCPGGETPAQVAQRADSLVGTLRGFDGDTLLFSSGHFLRMLAVRWLGLPAQAGALLAIDTASLGVLGYEHQVQQPTLRLWNDTGHLVG